MKCFMERKYDSILINKNLTFFDPEMCRKVKMSILALLEITLNGNPNKWLRKQTSVITLRREEEWEMKTFQPLLLNTSILLNLLQ